MPHTKKESKSIEKQIMKTNLIDYDIIDNMARNEFYQKHPKLYVTI